MDKRRFISQTLGIAAGALVISSSLAIAQAPPVNPPVRVRATIEKVDGNKLMVKSSTGQDLTITLADNSRVSGIVKIAIGEVKIGDFVGISSMPQSDGTLKAIHVHIFPEALRNVVPQSHFPWDNRPGSMMTNATVATTVSGNDGQTLEVKYKDGEKKVAVPADAIIVKYVPGGLDELKPGAKIFIIAATKQPDGSLSAANISIGRDGLTPPM